MHFMNLAKFPLEIETGNVEKMIIFDHGQNSHGFSTLSSNAKLARNCLELIEVYLGDQFDIPGFEK